MCHYENTHSLTLNSARCDSWSSLAQLICCSPVGCQKSGRNATITRSKELRAKCLKYLLITKEPHASGWLEGQDQEFFYNGIWGLKNPGPSAFLLERTMLKSDRIACLYPVVNCVKLRTFWTPLVAALCGSFVISKYLGIWHAALFYFFSFDCFCFTEYIIKLQFTLTLFDSSCCHCDGRVLDCSNKVSHAINDVKVQYVWVSHRHHLPVPCHDWWQKRSTPTSHHDGFGRALSWQKYILVLELACGPICPDLYFLHTMRQFSQNFSSEDDNRCLVVLHMIADNNMVSEPGNRCIQSDQRLVPMCWLDFSAVFFFWQYFEFHFLFRAYVLLYWAFLALYWS